MTTMTTQVQAIRSLRKYVKQCHGIAAAIRCATTFTPDATSEDMVVAGRLLGLNETTVRRQFYQARKEDAAVEKSFRTHEQEVQVKVTICQFQSHLAGRGGKFSAQGSTFEVDVKGAFNGSKLLRALHEDVEREVHAPGTAPQLPRNWKPDGSHGTRYDVLFFKREGNEVAFVVRASDLVTLFITGVAFIHD